MAGNRSRSVGLGGDGDEIAAIAEVERAFGVMLDYADAPGWHTAGDVFESLQKVLPADELNRPYLWKRFAVALSHQTGANPNEIRPDSPLLSKSRFWTRLADTSGVVWIIVLVSFFALLAAAVV